MKKLFSFIGICLLSATATAQADTDIVNIPDAAFKRFLTRDRSINPDRDANITYGEARAYTGDLDIVRLGITSLEGIAAFKNIKRLWCGYNQLTSLDVSQNTELVTLNCTNNRLTSIDVSQNTKLRTLYVNSNPISQIDVSQNTQLKELGCKSTGIQNLDVSHNPNLEKLYCDSNGLTVLDVSQNPNLSILECRSNKLSTLDLSNNSKLTELYCENNKLTALNLSANPLLQFFNCDGNLLTQLNLANGNNAGLLSMSALNNNLTCIQIDSGFTPPSNWKKDDAASYNADCGHLATQENSTKNNALTVITPMGDELLLFGKDKVQKVEIYTFSGQLVRVLTDDDRNVSDLPKGSYLLKITTDRGIQVVKTLK